MSAYYNENNPAAAYVLRCLVADGVVAPGDVDDRSIKDVMPDDLRGYTQCHFFAGGGLWSVAARLAGWPDSRPLWTGSCPCQPYSVAGKRGGSDDPRHLWPDFFRLIRAERPAVVMGEQVAGKAGYAWFDGIAADMAGEDYTPRSVDIPACAVDAPHIRNRLYWISLDNTNGSRGPQRQGHVTNKRGWASDADEVGYGDVANLHGSGRGWRASIAIGGSERGIAAQGYAEGELGDCAEPGEGRRELYRSSESYGADSKRPSSQLARPALRNGSFWSDHEWIICHDGKARRTKPGLRLLAPRVPGRVDCWRIAGNAINAPLAAEVIAAFMECGEPASLAVSA